jgi:uncharacterized membrane protein YhaH (DUF805 family)
MEIFTALSILFVLIGAFYLVKVKIDEGTLPGNGRKQFTDTSIKISSVKMRKTNNDNEFSFYVGRCFSKYANFDGTASKSEFWYFFLFSLIIGLIALVIDLYFFNELFDKFGMGLILGIGTLFFFIPQLSLSSRRLHDIGKSGWWQLIALTGFGVIVLYVWYATKSNPKLNKKYK